MEKFNCPNCKKQIDQNTKFCGYCGCKIEAQEVSNNKGKTRSFLTHKRLLIGIYGLAGISVVFVLIIFLVKPSIQKAKWEKVRDSKSIIIDW